MNNISRRRGSRLSNTRITCLALIALSFLLLIHKQLKRDTLSKCIISHGTYNGYVYNSLDVAGSGETIANQCLVESPWMRLAQHAVKLPSADGKQQVIADWLWIDYHDRINVLVEDPKSQPSEMRFLILEQTKYALDSQMSLSVVGGIIEPERTDDTQETPLIAAQREVHEEMGVVCQKWLELGKYRTDVNRGMGWVYPYLASECSYSNKNASEEDSNAVGAHDTEKQKVRSMSLSEVRSALMEGRFMEVQWSNTVALAMLHLQI